MKFDDLGLVLGRLLEEEVRFIIVGGLAVLAHGHSRVTHDLNIVIAMDSKNLKTALGVMDDLGFTPRLPVAILDFCDSKKRKEWIENKNLQVFSLLSERLGGMVVDIFATEPFDFEVEWANVYRVDLPNVCKQLPFVSRSTLISMKKSAGRTIDMEDIKHLLQDF
jgi:hypothetical protein